MAPGSPEHSEGSDDFAADTERNRATACLYSLVIDVGQFPEWCARLLVAKSYEKRWEVNAGHDQTAARG